MTHSQSRRQASAATTPHTRLLWTTEQHEQRNASVAGWIQKELFRVVDADTSFRAATRTSPD